MGLAPPLRRRVRLTPLAPGPIGRSRFRASPRPRALPASGRSVSRSPPRPSYECGQDDRRERRNQDGGSVALRATGYAAPMRAFTITAPNAGEVRDVETPRPGPGEALVGPAFVGICGTDYHIFRGSFLSSYPLTNGHEFSGTIAAVGADGGEWREGDRVTVDPTLYCGRCYHCLRRQANHCDAWGAIGDTTAGALAEFVTVPVRNLYRVEDHETLEDAAFTEPLACVVWGIERLRIRPGDRALVFGAGPIGCLMTQMLSLSPVADIVVVDVAPAKLRVATEMGARATFAASASLAAQLDERTEGRKFDLVVD